MREPELKVALVGVSLPGYQSLALGYVRAYCEATPKIQNRVAFQTLELTTDTRPWWLAYRILCLEPHVVGFSVACWNADIVRQTAELIKKADPSVVIVLGGPEVTPIAEETLAEEPSVDMVVRGEGEETFAELLHVLLTGKRPWMCDGVTARDGQRIVSAPDRPLIENLDDIPSPYLTGVLQPLGDSSYIESYRGCPHDCGYCYEGKGTSRVRCFSFERVRAEVEYFASLPYVEAVSFVDSVFNLNARRLSDLADILEPHVPSELLLHTIEVDMERIDEHAAHELRRAGVVSVETGPQTVGTPALDACGRSFDPERFTLGVNALRDAGIRVECDLIIGLPGDDPYDVIRGLRWLLALDPGIVQSSTLRVLPGTRFWEQSLKVGLAFQSEQEHAVIRTADMEYPDIRRLEVMSAAYQSAYRARSDQPVHV